MEPFATKSARHSKLHWWIISGVAAAFLVWQLDLIPRVRSAATGTVAKSMQKSPTETDSFLEDDWGDIRDEASVEMDSEVVDSADPLVHALAENKRRDLQVAAESDSRDANRINRKSSNARQDSQVAQVSFEADAPHGSDANPLPPPQAAVLTADIAARLRRIEEFIEADQVLEAHQEMSDIYWKHPEHRHVIQKQIDETAAIIFTTPERQFAEPHFVDYGETLGSIAKKYDVPWQYLARLNRIDPDELQAGQQLKVVRGPFGAVVDLENFCLTVHAHGWYVHQYPVGTGAENGTPTGKFTIEEKLENPAWYNPEGGVVDADDPENPLGEFWLGLGDHIGIHGTIDPHSIGQAISRGCIHLDDQNIEEVFALLTVGSEVLIRR
ncbi:MAG: L,D-transpeptidase family protein [Planctomycetaceae bacterium]